MENSITISENQVILENYIKIMSNPNHYYCTGDQSKPEEIEEVRNLHRLFESNAKSYVKGQKILIIVKTFHGPAPKNIFEKREKSYSIHEVTIHKAATKKIKKNQWVGDGYEDVTTETIQYATDTHIHTLPLNMLNSVPV